MSRHDDHHHGHDHHHSHHSHDEHHAQSHHHHEKHHHGCHGPGEKSEEHSQAPLSDRTKLMKVLEHWIHHNEEHAKSYGEWAERARGLGEDLTAGILEEIAAETVRQNEKFREALTLLHKEQESAPR